ncbi:nitronate monooxygenase [Brevibacillus borstelensis]|uniref:NAD(P)H-dependent flavin oxidoreductase n=1 Tax=Brevibacillus TaxID=55080 RepID=UPI00203F4C41|nr:nitronate monooxygenase [Brevibacillus borstelensis]MCM3621490.1 nitronate monooxygenase [Brevibacillus borstelensis]MED1852772.1 nitronate monooxygenase [Brevibacillus borstelensis]
MWTGNEVTSRLGIKLPIIQAGMAGGTTTPQLVAAVSQAGGLGTLGAGYMSGEQIRTAIRAIRELTDKPFGVNLFIPEEETGKTVPGEAVRQIMNETRRRLGIPEDPELGKVAEPFEEQMAAVLEERVPVFSFTFGLLDKRWMAACKQRGIVVIGTATTVREGVALEASGVDMVVAQGSEAGGHRGSFLPDSPDNLVGLMALVPQMADRLSIPVIAAGGIMDGRGIAAAFMLGAQAAQLGTAFLLTEESGAHRLHKQAVLSASDEATVLTTAFSGKAARGVTNEFMQLLAPYTEEIPAYPVQNALTRDIRQAASKQERSEFLSMWAGQAGALGRAMSAEELVRKLVEETEELLGKR